MVEGDKPFQRNGASCQPQCGNWVLASVLMPAYNYLHGRSVPTSQSPRSDGVQGHLSAAWLWDWLRWCANMLCRVCP